MELEIDKITIGSNRRDLDMNFVEELAQSIQESGLMHPIIVNMEYTLIAGLHRLEAVKLLGWGKIKCMVMDLQGLQAELAEIDENFIRSPLTEREKCKILSRRKKIYEELHPEAKNGGDRKSEKIRWPSCPSDFDPPKSFAEDAAEKLGVSARSVRRRVYIGEKVVPEAMSAFDNADEKFNQSEALKLTRIAPEHQEEAARQYVSGKIRTISDYKASEPDTADCGKAEQADIHPAQKDQTAATPVQDMKDGKKRKGNPDSFRMPDAASKVKTERRAVCAQSGQSAGSDIASGKTFLCAIKSVYCGFLQGPCCWGNCGGPERRGKRAALYRWRLHE